PPGSPPPCPPPAPPPLPTGSPTRAVARGRCSPWGGSPTPPRRAPSRPRGRTRIGSCGTRPASRSVVCEGGASMRGSSGGRLGRGAHVRGAPGRPSLIAWVPSRPVVVHELSLSAVPSVWLPEGAPVGGRARLRRGERGGAHWLLTGRTTRVDDVLPTSDRADPRQLLRREPEPVPLPRPGGRPGQRPRKPQRGQLRGPP